MTTAIVTQEQNQSIEAFLLNADCALEVFIHRGISLLADTTGIPYESVNKLVSEETQNAEAWIMENIPHLIYTKITIFAASVLFALVEEFSDRDAVSMSRALLDS